MRAREGLEGRAGVGARECLEARERLEVREVLVQEGRGVSEWETGGRMKRKGRGR